MAATKGLPLVSIFLETPLLFTTASTISEALVSFIRDGNMDLRSAPAIKSFFDEVMMAPIILSSLMTCSTRSPNSLAKSDVITFMGLS